MIRKFVWRSLLILCAFIISACTVNEIVDEPLCGDAVIVDYDLYNVATTSEYTITNVSVSGTCLTIEITASGCDGSSWEASLIDSGQVATSDPPIYVAKLVLTNNELCDAVIERSYTFDLSPISDGSTLRLRLIDWNEEIIINE